MRKQEVEELIQLIKPKSLLQTLSYFLEWEQETYMPKHGIETRSEHQELIAGMLHKEATSEKLKNCLKDLIDLETGNFLKDDFSEDEKAILREARRDFVKESKLPNHFVKKLTKTTTKSSHIWKEAKEKKDFSHFAPILGELVSLMREKADYLGYEGSPYNALLDLYEPGTTTHQLDALFAPLKEHLISLVAKIQRTPSPEFQFQKQTFDKDKQVEISHLLMEDMGICKDCCRLDTSAHPFCLPIGPEDVRITTTIHENSMFDTLSAVIHEAGHALYQLYLPKEDFGNPLGEPASFGVHESQSRFWEVYVGQSAPFWQYYAPKFAKVFPDQLGTKSWQDYYQMVNRVSPNFIRIYSDEVTYSLHIILRYEIEKGLLEQTIQVDDIPRIWNEKMQQYLGITPKHDSEGCLQDIHWSMCLFGYFPSYCLGNMYAAQLLEKLRKDIPDMDEQVRYGNLLILRDWMAKNVHSQGRKYLPSQLIEKVTEKPFSSDAYIQYLESKYPLKNTL